MPFGVVILILLFLASFGSFFAVPIVHIKAFHFLHRRITGKNASDAIVQKTVFFSLIAFPAFFFTLLRFGFFTTHLDGEVVSKLTIYSLPFLFSMYICMSFTWYRVFRKSKYPFLQELLFTVPGAIIALIPLSLSLSGIVALLYVAYGPDALLEFVLSIRNDI